MSTLLLKLAGPMQSWGGNSKYETRRTESMPTKSGVTGLLAAALGRERGADISDLSSLRYGVRADKEGIIRRDFHTVDKQGTKYVTYRYYIEDGVFLAGFESADTAFLESIEYALKHPVYPPFLGRKSCPPAQPLVVGIRDKCLKDALLEEPVLVQHRNTEAGQNSLRILMDAGQGIDATGFRSDYPVSFNSKKRLHVTRGICECRTAMPLQEDIRDRMETNIDTAHDAFSFL